MARTQLLRDWAIEEFGEKECPSYITLLSYAKNKMIYLGERMDYRDSFVAYFLYRFAEKFCRGFAE
ncbi:hypothetical protein B4907_14905 [Yersinia kristensenii]|nr:hypothetical protein B4907_14905 [Yersinia kristensenii]